MTDVIERQIEPELTAPDVGSVEAKARVFHFIRKDLPLDASQLVESLGTSRPEQVCVRIESALTDVEVAELYDFGEHCGRAGSVFSLDIIMSKDANIDAYKAGQESWLGSIVSTTQRVVNDNMVRWIIPIRAEFIDAFAGLHDLAREEYARPAMIMPHFIGQTTNLGEEPKATLLKFIDTRILGRESKLYGREDLHYYQTLRDHLDDPVEHPTMEISGLDIDQSETLGFSKSERIRATFDGLLKSIKGK